MLMLTSGSCTKVTWLRSDVVCYVMQEPWLVAVLSLQTLLLSSVILWRRNTSYLTCVFTLASKQSCPLVHVRKPLYELTAYVTCGCSAASVHIRAT